MRIHEITQENDTWLRANGASNFTITPHYIALYSIYDDFLSTEKLPTNRQIWEDRVSKFIKKAKIAIGQVEDIKNLTKQLQDAGKL